MDIETIAMKIIASAGDGKAMAFEALDEVKKGNFDKAKELLEQSEHVALEAHKAQTALIVDEANGNKAEVNVLLVHSQDHLMTGMLAQEMIREMIIMYEKMDEIKNLIEGVKQ